MYQVYVRVENGIVTAVNSSAFMTLQKGWVQIDEGDGDKFHHAQNNYFPTPILNTDGCYRFKYDGKAIVPRTSVELAADLASRPAAQPTMETRLTQLETELVSLKTTTFAIQSKVDAIEAESIIQQGV